MRLLLLYIGGDKVLAVAENGDYRCYRANTPTNDYKNLFTGRNAESLDEVDSWFVGKSINDFAREDLSPEDVNAEIRKKLFKEKWGG